MREIRRLISNLNPLVGLGDLTWLSLWGNQVIDAAPLSGLTNLLWLSLSENQIANLVPLSSLANLEALYLWENGIVGFKKKESKITSWY